MFLILLVACSVALAAPPTRTEFELLKEEVSCLKDSVSQLNEIIIAHEEYIGSDMIHKREKYETFNDLAKTDWTQLIWISVLTFLSGGHLISRHPLIKGFVIAWAASLNGNKKEDG